MKGPTMTITIYPNWKFLRILILLAGFGIGGFIGHSAAERENPPSSIGGTRVPAALECEEDEVIAFRGIDTLGCVHIDTFLP